MIFFGLARKSLAHVFFETEKGEYKEMIFDVNDGHLVWCGVIPKIQYMRNIEILKAVAILDNGDITK